MKNWFVLILGAAVTLVLYISLTLFSNRGSVREYEVDGTIEIIMKSSLHQPMDFWDVVNQGMLEAANELGVVVNITGPQFETQIDEQILIMNEAINRKPPVILLAATDYVRLVPPVEKSGRLNIPIIIFDSGIDSDIPVSFIATDNIDAGKKAGNELKRLLQNRSRREIAIVSHSRETATAIDREAGARDSLEGQNITGTWYIDVDREKAYQATIKLLENENLGGIVALNEAATLGVARAIDEKNLQEEVLVVGFDNAVRELQYLEKGVIKATVVQRPYNMGYLTVKIAVEYLNGRKVDKFIDTGSVLITRENMFSREYQELLFPISPSPVSLSP